MSVFGDIMHKIFSAAGAALGTAAAPTAIPSADVASPAAATASLDVDAATVDAAGAPAVAQPVDVEAVLTAMAAQKGGGGNWRSSIVDLLKLLDMDSSLDARKQLAGELGVHAGADGTAEQNIALHRAVMQKLADNGGKVPDSLKA